MNRDYIPRRPFYMARHGETEDNHATIVSRPKTPLTPTGVSQAEQLRTLVEHVFHGPERCYLVTSSLPRARRTAGLATPKNWSIHEATDSRFSERNNGNMAGRADYSEWVRVHNASTTNSFGIDMHFSSLSNGVEFINLSKSPVVLKGAETIPQHARRVLKGLRQHLTECPAEKIPLIICHEGTMKRSSAAVGHVIRHFKNGGLYKFEPSGESSWCISRVYLENGQIQEETVDSTPASSIQPKDHSTPTAGR